MPMREIGSLIRDRHGNGAGLFGIRGHIEQMGYETREPSDGFDLRTVPLHARLYRQDRKQSRKREPPPPWARAR